MTQKYYFISYSYINELYGLSVDNDAIQEHPFDWIKNIDEFWTEYNRKEKTCKFKKFALISYIEITEDEFYKYHGDVEE